MTGLFNPESVCGIVPLDLETTMSLAFACITKSGLVMAADSRITETIQGVPTGVIGDNGVKLFAFSQYPAAIAMTDYYLGIEHISQCVKFDKQFKRDDQLLREISNKANHAFKSLHGSDTGWANLEMIIGCFSAGKPRIRYARSTKENFRIEESRGNALLIGQWLDYNPALAKAYGSPVENKDACELACHLIEQTGKDPASGVGGETKICIINFREAKVLSTAEADQYRGKTNAIIEAVEKAKANP